MLYHPCTPDNGGTGIFITERRLAVANTDKQNFRCDTETLWKPFKEHVEALREAGYDVDMSLILRTEVELVVSETAEQTAARLGLVRPGKQGEAKSPVVETPEHTARRLRKLAAS